MGPIQEGGRGLEIGEKRKEYKIPDGELLDSYIRKYGLEEETTFIYTDGSKKEGANTTGMSIILEYEEEAYTISLNNKCSSYKLKWLRSKRLWA